MDFLWNRLTYAGVVFSVAVDYVHFLKNMPVSSSTTDYKVRRDLPFCPLLIFSIFLSSIPFSSRAHLYLQCWTGLSFFPCLLFVYNFRLSSLASTNDVLSDALGPHLPPSGRRRTQQGHGVHTPAITLGAVDILDMYHSMHQLAFIFPFPVFKSTFHQTLRLPSS